MTLVQEGKFPKVIAFEVDETIWSGKLDASKWGKGNKASIPQEDNLYLAKDNTNRVLDASNPSHKIEMFPEVPKVFADVLQSGAKLAIVSKNSSSALVARALYWLQAKDPRDNTVKPITKGLVDYFEVYDDKGVPMDKILQGLHMDKIKEYSHAEFADMILYDADVTTNLIRVQKGVIFQHCPKGLTWDKYQEGIETWKRLRIVRSPYFGQDLKSYPDAMWIGFSGMDEVTMRQFTSGGHRTDTLESARWGYAMYVADDLRVAKFFGDWIKDDWMKGNGLQDAKVYICEVWVRDKKKWCEMNKIWLDQYGDVGKLRDVQKDGQKVIAQTQEDVNAWAAKYGVHIPYVLFSDHWDMDGMDKPQYNIAKGSRINEMVVYTHVQDAQILVIPMTDEQVQKKFEETKNGERYIKWEDKMKEWNITDARK